MTYKEFAVDISKQAGKIMLQNFTMGMKKEWKSDNTPVTETDKKINSLVIEQVAKYFPEHDVLGEEESSLKNGSKFLWVCDPVDGTVPFSHGIPTFAFSLALVEDGQPDLGVIYDAFMDRLFVAEKGKGAFMNEQKISVNKLDLSRGVIGWSSSGVSHLKSVFKGPSVIHLWCICYEGMLVANGEFSATYYDHIKAHDIAALKVIVEEAGGKVTDKNGNEQRYDRDINGALITNGVLHEQLLEFSKK